MKHRETGSLIENNKTHRTWSLIGYQRHKLNMKKPRQDDGASCILGRKISKRLSLLIQKSLRSIDTKLYTNM